MQRHNHRTILILTAICVACCGSVTNSSAQTANRCKFPPEERPALDARLKSFLQAQAEGQWESVAELLGSSRRSYFDNAVSFTSSHKSCLIAQMQRWPMIAFEYAVQDSTCSSAYRFAPRTSWPLVGEATFQTGDKATKQNTWVAAYKENGEWFFSPGMDASRPLNTEQPSTDRNGDVDLLFGPTAPLELVDLHVFVDPKDAKLRDIHFRLRNKMTVAATQYGYKITDENERGSISFGTGAEKDVIGPNAISREFHESYALVQYLCEGEPRIRLAIDHVTFADGTEWRAPESPVTKK